MNYKTALKEALGKGWEDIITQDSIDGNGFQMVAYGLKLILGYAFWYTLRVLFAILAPVTALILMRCAKLDQQDRLLYEKAVRCGRKGVSPEYDDI